MLLGLGSIVGTGVYVSLGLAAGLAGTLVVAAVALAAALALLNGLSSAQLAAAYPVSGGSYEYAYRLLHPRVGFVAGWMFLAAKSASAAAAALGFGGYLADALGVGSRRWLAIGMVILLTAIILRGIRLASWTNTLIVAVAIGALVVLVLAALPTVTIDSWSSPNGIPGLFEATALMFVAYTGYGRIATLGEEVRNPRHTIPRAIIVTLAITMVLYGSVAVVAVGTISADQLADAVAATGAPLESVAGQLGVAGLPTAITVGAAVALISVVLNLLLGLSRVVLAMGRRRDLPRRMGAVRSDGSAPVPATVVVAGLVIALVAVGDIRLTWSFSAFTVLVYYAITNLAATRLPDTARRYPRVLASADASSWQRGSSRR